MQHILSIIVLVIVVSIGGGIILLNDQQSVTLTTMPQTPMPPFPYDVEGVTVVVDESDTNLGGTLTLPSSGGPFPAVILLTVAGPNDRDQSFAGHKGFQVLADHLTRNGVAVARFDDRGVGDSGGEYFSSSWIDLSVDALAMVAQLKADPRIDPARIGFAGMSQGGAIGALAASMSEDIAFLVLMSAPGLPGQDALSLQLEKTLEISGISGDEAEHYRLLFREFIDIVKSEPEDPKTVQKMREFLDGQGKALIPPYQFLPRDTEGLANVLLGAWYRSNVNFDPNTAYGKLHIPILAIGGTKDFVAPADSHLANIKKILSKASTSDTTISIIPNLNHLLQDAETGLPTEYASLSSSFSPVALATISKWIETRIRSIPISE